MSRGWRSDETSGLRKDIDFAGKEILGARESQEDYSLFRASRTGTELLAVLADGMGGHTGGEVASKKAVDSFDETFNAYPAGAVPAKLGAALHQANHDLASGIKNAPALDGMGCTLVGAYIDAQGLQWISVGDSPLFLYRNRRIRRLNADHSMTPVIEESRRQGKITNEEAETHPNRHALRSALTGDSLSMIDVPGAPVPLRKGDVVILASDGLLSLSEKEIAALVRSRSGATAESLARTLIAAVESKKKPRQDNTTVQVVILPTSLGTQGASTRSLGWLLALLALTVTAAISLRWMNEPAICTALPDVFPKSDVVVVPQPVRVPEDAATPAKGGLTRQAASPEVPAKADNAKALPSTNSAPASQKNVPPQPKSTLQNPSLPAKGAEGAAKGKPAVVHEDGATPASPAVQKNSMEPKPNPGAVPPAPVVAPKSVPAPPGTADTAEDVWSALKRGEMAAAVRILFDRTR